jgi:DnaK suppressor protein
MKIKLLHKKQKEYWMKKLLEIREQILRSVKHIIEDENSTGAEVGDEIDVASDNFNKELLFSLNDTDRRRLEDIEIALNKLQNGRFGLCEQCGKKIAHTRLSAKPYAKYCIRCKTNMEKPQ